MTVTRDVILDLLPLYLADEASVDTQTLVEEYLERDPKLAEIARRTQAIDLLEDIPVPLTEENQMETYKEAKRVMFWSTIIIAAIVSLTILGVLAFTVLVFFMVPG
jgi:hypothetical protein